MKVMHVFDAYDLGLTHNDVEHLAIHFEVSNDSYKYWWTETPYVEVGLRDRVNSAMRARGLPPGIDNALIEFSW
jgi:hypothetical protein